MQIRSIADLAKTIRAQAHRIPAEVDLVVGIPRSGMLAASIIALAMNRNLLDLNSCLSNARIDPMGVHAKCQGASRRRARGVMATACGR